MSNTIDRRPDEDALERRADLLALPIVILPTLVVLALMAWGAWALWLRWQ